MAVFKKEIIRPTRVFPFDSRGKEYPVDIGFDRIQHWAAGLKKLFKKGYRIPIPYDHTQEAVPLGPEEEEPVGPDGEPLYRNAGFFTDIEFERDGTLHLLGEPKTEQDLKRVLKDHVSLKSAETFRDRDGEVYEDVIVHVAATNKPIFTKQSEWKPAHGLALSLGQPNEPLSTPYPTSGNDPGGPGKTNSLENILELLREHGLELPDDTDEMNFLDRLGTALRAVKSYKEQGGGEADVTKRPEGSRVQRPVPIAMSQPNTPQSLIDFAIATVAEQPTNPVTKKPWTAKELEQQYESSKPPTLQLSAADQARINWANEQFARGLVERCEKLVKDCIIPQKTAEDWLKRLTTEEIQLAAEQGRKTHVEEMIEMAELLRPGSGYTGAPTGGETPQGSWPNALQLSGLVRHERPEGFEGPTGPKNDAEAESNADELLKNAGY